MRHWSLRGWLFLVSLLFAVLVVGGVAVTTYVIVSDGMQVVAYETTERVSLTAAAVVREAVVQSEIIANRGGYLGTEFEEAARQELTARLPALLSGGGLANTFFAVYTNDARPIWSSNLSAIHTEFAEARQQAIATGETTRSMHGGSELLHGLVYRAELGVTVVHVPLRLPGGDTGVLDVTYLPRAEERVIDAIRLPMTVLAISTMMVMVVLMQTSMVWVLNLVDDLRKAADSIDAGRLDERLPEGGDNEIGELGRSINRLIERLRRRADAQSRFVADASHELATPVAGIRGYTSILRAWGADDVKVRDEAIDAIDRESRRMARLTSDLLNLLHADQGLRLQSERFDLNALIRDRLAATASRYIEKNVEFRGPRGESLLMVGDPGRVEDILSILLDNAGKYTPDGGAVTVDTSRKRDSIVLTVTDTGKGVPEQDIPRLFDRFFRSEQARADGESGFGLGLAIAKSIVESMGGTIEVVSEVGVGTTFTIVLPRGRA